MDNSDMGLLVFVFFSVFYFWKLYGFVKTYKSYKAKGKKVDFYFFKLSSNTRQASSLGGMSIGIFLVLSGLFLKIDFYFPIVTFIVIICVILLYQARWVSEDTKKEGRTDLKGNPKI